jgi:PHP family Zn ribbon phosphoesterase
LYRVQQLASESLQGRTKVKMSTHSIKWYTDAKKIQPPYVKLVPLNEIIAESIGSPVTSPKVKVLFDALCEKLQSELFVLLKAPLDDIAKVAGEKVRTAIEHVREGVLVINPGFDGEYGKVKIFAGETQGIESNSTAAQGASGEDAQLGLL